MLSDIHANLPAFEAVLADMPEVSALWVLGDIIGELPFPVETLDLLMHLSQRLPVRCVAGNREVSLLEAHHGEHPTWWVGTQMRTLAWTVDQLRPEHWSWMKGLPSTLSCGALPGGALLFHGSPTAVRGQLFTADAAKRAASGIHERWLLGGHTHQARFYRVDGHSFINAGSIGISLDGIGGTACYVLIDETNASDESPGIQFRYVAYDVGRVLRALETSGLAALAPGISRADALEMQTGRHHVMSLLQHAAALAKDALGSQPAAIPPALWERAEREWTGDEWLPGRSQ